MQVTQTSADGLKREFKVVIGAQEIGDKIDARLEELSRSLRLPGFRPGKVPVSVVKTRYGGAVKGEVLEDAVKAGANQAITEHELRPVVEPRIEVTKFEEGADLEYTMSLEVMPEIEPADIGKIALEKLVCEVADSDVDEALGRIANETRSFESADAGHEARSGDALVIDFVGKIDGEPFEGGSAQDHQLELGSNSFVDTFEDQLIGAKAGDRREVTVTFPEEFVNEEYAGKQALFEVEVKEVKVPLPVAVDDELARNMGLDSLDALKTAVRERIEHERGSVSRARLKRSLLDALAERHDFEVPPTMVEIEFDTIWKQLQEELQSAQSSFEDTGRSEEEAREEYRRLAERRVRLGLLLSEIGRRNNIEVQDDELKRAMVERARGFPGQEQVVLNYLQRNEEAANQLRAPLFEDKVIDFLLEMAQVSERNVSLDELLRDPDEEADTAAATKAASDDEASAKKPKKPAKKPRDEAGAETVEG